MTSVNLFPGTVTSVTVGSFTPGVTFATSDHAPWSDDTDDTSQALLEMDWGGSSFTTFSRAKANLPALTGTPTGLVLHMRARNLMLGASTSEDAHVQVALQNSSQSIFVPIGNESTSGAGVQHIAVPVSPLFQDFTVDLSTPINLFSMWGTSLSSVVTLLQSGAAQFQVQVDVYTPHGAFSEQVAIAALWLEATGIPSASAPVLASFPNGRGAAPLRIHPRNDGLGTSSAPRIYPAPKSYQASNRRAGGYL